jgi:hypothetical protein
MEGMRTNTLGLLEFLAANAGCMYLSDLTQTHMQIGISHILRSLDASAFSLREWNDAAAYLTRRPCSFETAELAKQYLLDNTPRGQ